MTPNDAPLLRKSTTWIVLATAVAGTLAGGAAGVAVDAARRLNAVPRPAASARPEPRDEARWFRIGLADPQRLRAR